VKPYRLKLLETASGVPHSCCGKYVKTYDVAFVHPHGYDGGKLVMTSNPDEALAFDSQREAFELWRSTAPAPYDKRPDGKPNRPLTAFTVEVEEARRRERIKR
jgi:hypothetical protein